MTSASAKKQAKHLAHLRNIAESLPSEVRTDAEREQDEAIEARAMLSEFLAEEL